MCGFYGPYGAIDGWGWVIGLVTTLVFWGGLIVLGIWAIRAFSGRWHSGDTALDILRRRLASGEITQDEYEKTRRVLQP
jgi:uncharacterized membrane protein